MTRKNDDSSDLSIIFTEAANRAVKPTVPTTPQNTWINDALDTNTTTVLAKVLEGAFAADNYVGLIVHNANATIQGANAIKALRDTATTPEELANNTQIAKAFTEEMARGVGQITAEVKGHLVNTVKTPYAKPVVEPPKPKPRKGLFERIFDPE